ncbi:FAD-dependent oxidoreductase [Kitasatospora kifunensis]|uniref:D-amino-acid oxidase n=1 Tax=Kitasatospora kifunensis TaxID=58351 RepID=A0A7W7R8P3_KITKI|nr:FAD-dependent oxidoreductase [Kitasatospora kifunensis]MBB4927320.1 D-amino-acid oxidase [Kitasatospora kifunensis]
MLDVVVVGAGVIGLTSALSLQRQGARVAVVTGDLPLSTTSAVAAAVWYPTGMAESDQVVEWSASTFAELARQAEGAVPGVSMRPTRMLTRQDGPPVPWWAAAVPDLRALEPTAADRARLTAGGWEFTAPSVEMPRYLTWLVEQFREGGGEMIQQRLDSLERVVGWAPAVVNASGLGARRLCGDQAVYPVRGQVVLVRNPGLRTSLRVQGDPAGYTYVHPRSNDVVLGGTFEEGSWDTAVDPRTAESILRRCTVLVPELADAEVTGQLVGLRPARRGGVRLAVDDRTLPGTRLVHNYGHGGAGVTLAWGCAATAAALLGAGGG